MVQAEKKRVRERGGTGGEKEGGREMGRRAMNMESVCER